jgi:hypothetical protein
MHRHEVGDHLIEHSHAGDIGTHDHRLSGFEGLGEIAQRHIVHRRVHHGR